MIVHAKTGNFLHSLDGVTSQLNQPDKEALWALATENEEHQTK